MPVSRKLWLRPGRELPRRRLANDSVRKLSSMPRGENEAVHIHRLGLSYERKATPKLATETEAHRRDPLIVSSRDA
jgi:hypothetical protein